MVSGRAIAQWSVGVAVIAGIIWLTLAAFPALPPNVNCDPDVSGVHVFDEDALKATRDAGGPLLLVVLGEVFDVSAGERFYAPGEGYHCFIGQDASRAFHTGEFGAPPAAEVRDLPLAGVQAVLGWRAFYRNHAQYAREGVVRGLYYDCAGRPTPALAEVEALGARAEAAEAAEKRLRAAVPTCGVFYEAARKATDFSCGEPARIRELRWTHALTGARQRRCACVAAADEPQLLGEWSGVIEIGELEGCEGERQQCTKPSG